MMDFLEEACNYPIVTRYRQNLEYIKNGLVKGAVSLKAKDIFIPHLYEKYIRGHENEDVIHCGKGQFMDCLDPYYLFVDQFFLQDRVLEYISLEKLREPLTGKKVWCKTAGSYQEMMTRHPNYYAVMDDDTVPDDGGRRAGEFKPVDNQEESLLALVAFHYKYAFDDDLDMFVKLPVAEQKQNLLKPWMEYEVNREAGNNASRIADYGRLIRFLLSKVTLSDEEQAIFSDVLAKPVEMEDIDRIIKREKKILSKIKAYKEGTLL
jgi:hypothetical protein